MQTLKSDIYLIVYQIFIRSLIVISPFMHNVEKWLEIFKNLAARFLKYIRQFFNTRTSFEICPKLTIKTPERCQWRRSGVFIVSFQHISKLVLVFLLLTFNM